jgi:pimeloyl-ACP methyl ester carboxylesterase
MTIFVLVHGGWHGGWCWREVAARLRVRGHEVHAPTLTGLGDRAHLRDPLGDRLGLTTHVDDVAALLETDDLRDVVLVGHSYAGLVIEGVAGRVPERIGLLVHLDSFVPGDRTSLFDLLSPERRAFYEDRTAAGAVTPPPVAALGITDPVLAGMVEARLTRQPLRTFTEAATAAAPDVARRYVHCTEGPLAANFARFAAAAREDPGWGYDELACGHDAMLVAPDELAALLAEPLRHGRAARRG